MLDSGKSSRWFVTFRALRHRNYRLYFIGQLVSLLGSWVQAAALMWLAWELTNQSFWPGLVSAAQIVPTFLLGAWGGGLADRWPRRPIILTTQAAQLLLALVLFFLTWLGHVTAWQLLAVSLATGLVNAVDFPARLAFVMDLVGREDLSNAVALNSLLFNAARAAGPALYAWLLQHLTVAHCFLINSVSFVAVLLALAWMDPIETKRSGPRKAVRLNEAFAYLGERPGLLLLIALTAAIAFFGWPVLVVLPALADRQLISGHREFSTLVSAIGFGALLSALLVASVNAATWCRALIASGIFLAAVGLAGLAEVTSLPLAKVNCMVIGAGLIMFLATSQSIVQLGAGDDNRGRIMGIYSMVLSGAVPLGNLAAGKVADVWGVSAALGVQAVGIAIAAGLILAIWLVIRRRPRPDREKEWA